MDEKKHKSVADFETRGAAESLEALIHFAGGPKLPCSSGDFDSSCLSKPNTISWGRPLTKREYDYLCDACRAYWHLCAARNDMLHALRLAQIVAAEIDEAIAKAIDTKDAKMAGNIADALRTTGSTYAAILTRVQKIRPAATAAEWDDLLSEADEIEAGSVRTGDAKGSTPPKSTPPLSLYQVELRDEFAKAAVTGVLGAHYVNGPPTAKRLAESAYEVADAMLKERSK